MASRFIIGVPGGGKSLTATEVAQKELRKVTDRPREVVTNMKVFPGQLWNFIRHRFGIEVDVNRVTRITDEQAQQFYLHRGRGWVAGMPKQRKEGGDGFVDYAQCRRGEEVKSATELPPVLYLIDEAHLLFGARNWQNTADSALFYLSQHRKLGDDVFFITQHLKQVDPALRRLSSEFWRVTNYGSRFPFGVKLPDVFVIDVFASEPNFLTPAIDTKVIRLDVEGLCQCYDTAAGVGLVGTLADTQQKRKGIPWQAVAAAAVLLLCCGLAFPWAVGAWAKETPLAAGMGRDSRTTNAPPVTNIPPVTVKPPAPAPRPPAPVELTPLARLVNGAGVIATNRQSKLVVGPSIEPDRGERLKFFIRRENGFVVLGTENGDVFSVGDGRLQVVGKLAVVDGNRAYRLPE